MDQLDAHVAAERLDHLLALVLAHQPGVDVDAGELLPDRPVHQRRRNRRVDAARERAETRSSPTWSRICATCSSMTTPSSTWARIRRGRAGGAQHRHAVRRVDHLGVELHAPDAARRSRARPPARRACGRGPEAGRRLDDGVEVAHPDIVLVGESACSTDEVAVRVRWRAAVLAARRDRPCRRAAGRSAGRRSRCRGSARRGRRSPGRAGRPRRGRSSGRRTG